MPMIQAYNSWVKWIALEINQTNESQINSNDNDDQLYPIEQSTIRPNAPIIIIPIALGLQRLEDWRLI